MEAFDEVVGLRGTGFAVAVRDLVQRQGDLKGMVQFAPAKLTVVVGEQVFDIDVVFVAERHDATIEDVGGRFFEPRGGRSIRGQKPWRCQTAWTAEGEAPRPVSRS